MPAYKYKYDLAISLCKQDVEFARKLVKALNPSIKVFFYEDRQEELISKSGPEAFARIFKEESRLVLILSRKEWSQSYYTEIERNAIVDRTSVQGYRFLMVMPMVQGETPAWYPSTQIYANPHRFTLEDLAKFVEFKITEEGGEVKPLTVDERYAYLLQRIEEKKNLVLLQETPEAIVKVKEELAILREVFNKNAQLLQQSPFGETSTRLFHKDSQSAFFRIGDYLLDCRFKSVIYSPFISSQDFILNAEIIEKTELERKSQLQEEWLFLYSEIVSGWSKAVDPGEFTVKDQSILFRNTHNTIQYDLSKPVRTEILVDRWFQKLLDLASSKMERYL